MPSENEVHVSIVVPVYNEEDVVLETVAGIDAVMRKHGASAFEIVVVNDGSTDKTASQN